MDKRVECGSVRLGRTCWWTFCDAEEGEKLCWVSSCWIMVRESVARFRITRLLPSRGVRGGPSKAGATRPAVRFSLRPPFCPRPDSTYQWNLGFDSTTYGFSESSRRSLSIELAAPKLYGQILTH